jgi:hypothetical protein
MGTLFSSPEPSTPIDLPEAGRAGPQGPEGPRGPSGNALELLTSPEFNSKLKNSTFYCDANLDYCTLQKKGIVVEDMELQKNLNVFQNATFGGLATVDDSMNVYGTLQVGNNKLSNSYLINLGTTGAGSTRSGYISGNGINMTINNMQNGDMIFATNNSNRMYLKPTGNFGLGTDNPQSILHIKGNGGVFNLEGTDHSYMQFYPRAFTGGRKAYIGFPSANSNVLEIANQDTGNINMTSQGDICFNYKDTAGATKTLCARNIPTSIPTVTPYQNPYTSLTQIANGNIGLGTTSPQSDLDIVGVSLPYTSTENSNNNFMIGTGKTVGTTTTDQVMYMGNYKDGTALSNNYSYIQSVAYGKNVSPLYLNNRGGNIIMNKDSGNVGIGTTNPQGKLDVEGKMCFSKIKPASTVTLSPGITQTYPAQTYQICSDEFDVVVESGDWTFNSPYTSTGVLLGPTASGYATGRDKISLTIPFKKSGGYAYIPSRVLVTVDDYDISNAANMRLSTKVKSITKTNFILEILTWANSVIGSVSGSYMVFA